MTDPLPFDYATALPADLSGTVLHCDSNLVGVQVAQDGRRLVAIRPICAGMRLFVITGRETPTPTRYSLQVGAALHLDQDCAHDMQDVVRRYFWRYMDHDCDPTTIIRHRAVIAVRDIEPGDAITFNYNTTELELAEPFRCRCDSALCVGVVRGARHMTAVQRARVEDLLPDYLR